MKLNARRMDGYLESEEAVVTWCVGHLVTMSYPEKYDEKYKRWRLDTLPFLPSDLNTRSSIGENNSSIRSAGC